MGCARGPSLRRRIGAVWLVTVSRSIVLLSRYDNANPATYICISCNLQEEKEKLWLSQLRADSDRSHSRQHTLALVTDPSISPEGETNTARLYQLEGKLDRLCAQFAKHESVVSERLQSLEELLKRVLAGTGGSGHDQLPNPARM